MREELVRQSFLLLLRAFHAVFWLRAARSHGGGARPSLPSHCPAARSLRSDTSPFPSCELTGHAPSHTQVLKIAILAEKFAPPDKRWYVDVILTVRENENEPRIARLRFCVVAEVLHAV